MRLTGADLFCGAGGFSEGFRQAGIDVTGALDLWKPCVLTHRKDHPETVVFDEDILGFDPARIGRVDVLFGSPPCTEFSFANRGGGGDIALGMKLVYRFLRFVVELEPRWWIMENVPRLERFLPAEVPLRDLGIDRDGALEIPVRKVLVSSDYGAPQKRARFFSGSFPLPPPTHDEHGAGGLPRWRTLGDVVRGLPDPFMCASDVPGGVVRDPVYGVEIAAAALSDHFSSSPEHLLLTETEAEHNRRAKTDHSWYGRMSFPDDLERPGRTIVSTQLRSSRETIVVPAGPRFPGRYRRLSVRESSSVQAFPITYQWWGTSDGIRLKQIGNAVAPPVAYAIAREIVRSAGGMVPERPYVVVDLEPSPPARIAQKKPRPLALERRFRDHVPGSKGGGFRVDLDNSGTLRLAAPGWTDGDAAPTHLVDWRAVLYRGSGKSLRIEEVRLGAAVDLAAASLGSDLPAFAASLISGLERAVPDASTLQAAHAERVPASVPRPGALLAELARIVAAFGPPDLPVSPGALPPRVACALLGAAFIADLADRSGAWLCEHTTTAFAPSEGAVASISRLGAPDVPFELRALVSRALLRAA